MIVEKYGVQRGGSCSEEAQGPYGVSLEEYQKWLRFFSFKVGNISCIHFWRDVW